MDDRHSRAGFTVVFESLGEEPGLEVVDPIERRRRTLRASAPVSPSPADGGAFPFPVETAVEVETADLSLSTAEQVIVRDAEGQTIDDVEHGESVTFPLGAYTLEVSGVIKTYMLVEAAVEICPDGHGTSLSFGEPTSVRVGCRSVHERPAATIRTTSEPSDVLAAISTFGSALKTTTPERSLASFRGHPPRLEVGDELDLPAGLEPPADDLHVAVPAEHRYALPVAPLAYYLGAPVREGPVPRLAGDGIDYPIAGDPAADTFEDGVERLLERVFFLDCVTRTEGIYQVELYERSVLESRVDLDFQSLYEASQPERLERYLEVPYEDLADLVPDWRNAAHVQPGPDGVETLPYLVDDLAFVRIADPERVPPEVVDSGGIGEFTRRSSPGPREQFTRGTASSVGGAAIDGSFVNPTEQTGALEETWVGDGTPIGATKAVPEAFENRIGRTASTGSIDITVVCNADAMAEERDVVDEVYGSRASLPFDVTVYSDATTEELAAVLAEPADFLHYVGHIEEAGFECADGHLDAATLEEVGVDAFFLNACQSYDQGLELVRNGAIGGIVTIRDVVNFGAVRIGRAVARLLNCGFPLRPAIEIARGESVVGSLYVVLGDGGLSIVQCESGTPMLLEVEAVADDCEVCLELFGAEPGIGGMYYPLLDASDEFYLASGSTGTLTVDDADLEEFLAFEEFPVRCDDGLCWSSELALGAL